MRLPACTNACAEPFRGRAAAGLPRAGAAASVSSWAVAACCLGCHNCSPASEKDARPSASVTSAAAAGAADTRKLEACAPTTRWARGGLRACKPCKRPSAAKGSLDSEAAVQNRTCPCCAAHPLRGGRYPGSWHPAGRRRAPGTPGTAQAAGGRLGVLGAAKPATHAVVAPEAAEQ